MALHNHSVKLIPTGKQCIRYGFEFSFGAASKCICGELSSKALEVNGNARAELGYV